MTDEVKRQKYRYLLNRVQSIRAKTLKLEEDSKELNTYLSESFKVNDEGYAKEEFSEIKDQSNKIKKEQREKLIYSISKKI